MFTVQVSSAVLFAISSLAIVALCSEPKVEVHNTFKPEVCDRKAQTTDQITLHYKGSLENGEVFDSR